MIVLQSIMFSKNYNLHYQHTYMVTRNNPEIFYLCQDISPQFLIGKVLLLQENRPTGETKTGKTLKPLFSDRAVRENYSTIALELSSSTCTYSSNSFNRSLKISQSFRLFLCLIDLLFSFVHSFCQCFDLTQCRKEVSVIRVFCSCVF